MKIYKCDVLVVGGGPAGSNAKDRVKEADVLVIEKKEIGSPVQCAKVFNDCSRN